MKNTILNHRATRAVSLYILVVTTFFISQVMYSQENPEGLSGHINLVGGIWKGEGSWMDGSPFKQSVVYTWGLNKQILKVQTFGNIKKEGNEFGIRNEGLRYQDPETRELKFMELDIFGGVTPGTISYEGKNLFYTYSYKTADKEMTLTDAWEYIDDDHYTYTVGIYEDGEWKQKFLSTIMTRFKEQERN